jgi:accessory gene regulator protein AgrB
MKCVSIKAMKSIRCVLASVLFFMSLSQVYLDFSSNYGKKIIVTLNGGGSGIRPPNVNMY